MAKTITLTMGYFTVVDDADFERLSKFKWYARKGRRRVYAVRLQRKHESEVPSYVYMHHEVLGVRILTDHKDRDGLNNRRFNLRPATKSQNAANAPAHRDNPTGFRGVTRHLDGRWRARIMVDGKLIHLGLFDRIENAATAYDQAAINYFGEYAGTNFTDVHTETPSDFRHPCQQQTS